MKKDNALNTGQTSLARVCYHSARYDIREEYIRDLVEETLPFYKGNIRRREAYGLFFAALRLNYNKATINLMRMEIERHEASPDPYSALTRFPGSR